MRTLCMVENTEVVTVTPNKPNIQYIVRKSDDGDIGVAMADIVDSVLQKRTRCERVIIYCRTLMDCTRIFRFFRIKLGQNLYEPPGAPNLACFRLVDMYCSCTHDDTQESILTSFMNPTGNLRVVIATIAFGLGLDCPNVRFVVHWGPPANAEAYLQETGRAGRDGTQAQAILYHGPGQLRKDMVEEHMIEYCRNTQVCRRELLLRDFDSLSSCGVTGKLCCDVCSEHAH